MHHYTVQMYSPHSAIYTESDRAQCMKCMEVVQLQMKGAALLSAAFTACVLCVSGVCYICSMHPKYKQSVGSQWAASGQHMGSMLARTVALQS